MENNSPAINKRQLTKQELEKLVESKEDLILLFQGIALHGRLMRTKAYNGAYCFVSQIGDDVISKKGTFLPAEAEEGADHNDTRLTRIKGNILGAQTKDKTWTLYYREGTKNYEELKAYLR